MKLTIISHYPPIQGGISKYTQQMISIMKHKNINVSVIPVESIGQSIKVMTSILKLNPDIIRLEFAISMYRLSSLVILFQLFILKVFFKKKLVVNFHEVNRDTISLGLFGVIFYAIISKLFILIFVHTYEAKNTLIKKCKVNLNKIIVLPHGLYLPSTERSFSNTFYKSNKKIILFFGYIHIHKGIEYLIEAYGKLLEDNSKYLEETELLIVGIVRKRQGIFRFFQKKDEQYYEMLVNKADKSIFKLNIKFLGFVDDNELNDLISKAYVIVLPYTSTEQSGVLNQALYSHIPIIASDIGGLGETLRNTGILVEPRNILELSQELKNLLSDSNHYRNIQKNYKTNNKRLDPSLIVDMQIEFYKKLIQ